MLRKLQIHERATKKFLDLEPNTLGLLLVLRNNALNEKIHIELGLEDMKAMVALLQVRIQDVELEMKGY